MQSIPERKMTSSGDASSLPVVLLAPYLQGSISLLQGVVAIASAMTCPSSDCCYCSSGWSSDRCLVELNASCLGSSQDLASH